MSSAKPKNIARHVRENTTMWGEGIAFFESGDYAKAEETFSSMDFVTSAVLFNSGTCSLAQGDIEKAIETYTETLKRDKHFVMAYCQRAMAFHLYGWNEDSLRDLHEAHTRLRRNRFIDYTNLGLAHILWECQILANMAIIYVELGLERHAAHYLELAHKSREDSFNDRPGNDTQELLEAALPAELVSDLLAYCARTERHEEKSCSFVQIDPQPLFKPRGLSSLWLQASHRIKKNYMGKAKVLYCLGAQREPGFEGAQAKAAGMPLPMKSDREKAAGGPLTIAFNKTLKKHGRPAIPTLKTKAAASEPRAHRTSSDAGPATSRRSEEVLALASGMRQSRSQSNPGSTTSMGKNNSLQAMAQNATLKSKRDSMLSSVSERSNENCTLQSQRNGPSSRPGGRVKDGTLVRANQPQAFQDTGPPIYDDIDDDGDELQEVLEDELGEDLEEEMEKARSPSPELVGELTPTEAAALTALQLLSEQLVCKQRNSLGNQAAIKALLKSISDITNHLQGETVVTAGKEDDKPRKTASEVTAVSRTPSTASSTSPPVTLSEAGSHDFDFSDDNNLYQYHETLPREEATPGEHIYVNHQPEGSSTLQAASEMSEKDISDMEAIYMNCQPPITVTASKSSTSSNSSSSTLVASTQSMASPALFQLTKNSFVKQVESERSTLPHSPEPPQSVSPPPPRSSFSTVSNGYCSAPERRMSSSTSVVKKRVQEDITTQSCDEHRGRRRLSSAFDVLDGDVDAFHARMREKKAAVKPPIKNSIPMRAATRGAATPKGAHLTTEQHVATLQRSSTSDSVHPYVNIQPQAGSSGISPEDVYESIAPPAADGFDSAASGTEREPSRQKASAMKAKKKPPKKPDPPVGLNRTPKDNSPSPPMSDSEKRKRPVIAPKSKPVRAPQPASDCNQSRVLKNSRMTPTSSNQAMIDACLDQSIPTPESGVESKKRGRHRKESIDSEYSSRSRSVSSTSGGSNPYEVPSDGHLYQNNPQRSRAYSSSVESDATGTRTRVTSLSSAYETDSPHALPARGHTRQRLVSFSDLPPTSRPPVPSIPSTRERQQPMQQQQRGVISDLDTDTDLAFDDEKYGLPAAKVAAITRWRNSQTKPVSGKPRVSNQRKERLNGPAARKKSSERVPAVVDCSS